MGRVRVFRYPKSMYKDTKITIHMNKKNPNTDNFLKCETGNSSTDPFHYHVNMEKERGGWVSLETK